LQCIVDQTFRCRWIADEDDAIQIIPAVDTTTKTKGLYGNVTFNINMSKDGEIILKLRATSADNARFAAWFNELKAGLNDPGTIVISDSNYRHVAQGCLPTRPGTPSPAASEDPSIEWSLQVATIEFWEPIVTELF
jgi:hypothetical protein